MEELSYLIFPLVVFVFLLLFALVFVYMAFLCIRKDPTEEGIKPIFQEQCGGIFDFFYLTAPFVRLAIYDNFIVIAYCKKRITLNYCDINKVSIKRYVIFKGITIEHSHKDISRRITIWSFSPKHVCELLKEKGVRVETN
jgi:hypothetical protein